MFRIKYLIIFQILNRDLKTCLKIIIILLKKFNKFFHVIQGSLEKKKDFFQQKTSGTCFLLLKTNRKQLEKFDKFFQIF
jgi:hypothetical protein